MKSNLLIVHGGGPTAVLNTSLYGAINEAKKSEEIEHIYGAINGTGGFIRGDFVQLENIDDNNLKLLMNTPGSAIGTSRDPLEKEDYKKMVDIMIKNNIKYVVFNGGNGTMDSCGKLYKECTKNDLEAYVIGIPKTMDNDIAVTDHSPGFGSAAKYMAQSVKEVCADVKGLSIHAVVIEASGRNAGWITASSALADETGKFAPDLIYLPERAFDETKFIKDVKEKLEYKKGIVIVCSEGLKDKDGNPIVKPIFKVGRATYFGDVSSYLANLIIKELGYKARGEKPGLLGRASIALQSKVDRDEAEIAGKEAVKACLNRYSGKMVAFKRLETKEYKMETLLLDIDSVMLHEKTMPDEFINEEGNGVTKEFIEWCKPLIGDFNLEMINFMVN